MPQMVRREMEFIAPRVAQEWRASYACAVHEDVQRRACGKKLHGEGIDRGRVDQVHCLNLDPVKSLKPGRGLVVIARRDDYPGTGCMQHSRGLQTDAGRAAGDNGYFAAQVNSADDLAGCRGSSKARADGSLLGQKKKPPCNCSYGY